MAEILILMFGGMIIGHVISSRKKLVNVLEKLIMWSIFLLLFLLGIAIGRNPEIMQALGTLGLTAMILSLGGIGGSVIMAYVLWRIFFREKKSSHEE